MKPTFYKPVLVLFFVSKRNLFLPNKFLVRKQNRAGLQRCFVTNTAHITSMQAECKSLAVNLFFNFFQWHESVIHNLVGILRLFPQATMDPPEIPDLKFVLVYF